MAPNHSGVFDNANWRLFGAVVAGALGIVALALALDAAGANGDAGGVALFAFGVAYAAGIRWRFGGPNDV